MSAPQPLPDPRLAQDEPNPAIGPSPQAQPACRRRWPARLAQRVAVLGLTVGLALGLVSQGLGQAEPSWWPANSGRWWQPEMSGQHPAGRVSTLLVDTPPPPPTLDPTLPPPALPPLPGQPGAPQAFNTLGHPFFTALGRNGRACVTCHQPADGMALSLRSIQERWQATAGRDPLFAPIDGADCPNAQAGQKASHRLLLERGLIRIPRPWPPRDGQGRAITPEFTLEVVRDPTGCNLNPQHGLHSATPYVSVYRRPRPATNTRFLEAMGFDFEPKNGLPLQLDPRTGRPVSGNLLADGRALSLRAQAAEAMRWHLEVPGPLPEAVLSGVVEFQQRLVTAMAVSASGGALDSAGAQAGPRHLATQLAGELQSTASKPIWGEEFGAWMAGPDAPASTKAFRDSVYRGARLFSGKTFLITDSAGLNNIPLGNPVRDACSLCHNMQRTGMDVAPGQIDLGTTNLPHASPAPELPLFRLTCRDGARPHPYLGRVVYTQDPGYALTTGQCRDIGKITMQSFRGLAARAPYFVNGSARSLREVVDFYDRRYRIGYTEQEKQDLVNLMSVL